MIEQRAIQRPKGDTSFTPEEVKTMLDETVWLYMRELRRMLHWDREITRFINDVCPDIVAQYGLRRLLEMGNGMHRPDFTIAKRIANQ